MIQLVHTFISNYCCCRIVAPIALLLPPTMASTSGLSTAMAWRSREIAAALLACGIISLERYGDEAKRKTGFRKQQQQQQNIVSYYPQRLIAHCEAASTPANENPIAPLPPSLARRSLVALRLASQPIPRFVTPNDPALTLSRRLLRQRQRDEDALRSVQHRMIAFLQAGDKMAAGKLLQRSYEIIYGKNIQPQDRQDFLQRYGCTGWTEEVLETLLALSDRRGIVEIGAGHGQWARILTDRYTRQHQQTTNGTPSTTKHFDFVLAFDDNSELPLDTRIYNERTQPHHDFFYRNVQPCPKIEAVLQQWQCRGRVLLLVYPPPDTDMAVQAARAYVNTSPLNDTIVYVGEGRGGANGSAAFFDYIESGEWILTKILPVRSFGDKGYEQLYVLKRVARGGGEGVK